MYTNAGLTVPRTDAREWLKSEAQPQNPKPPPGFTTMTTPFPNISDHYLVLDSAEKYENSRPEEGEFIFNFMVEGVTRNQTIGVRNVIENVVSIQIMPFYLPLLPDRPFKLNDPQADKGLPRLLANPSSSQNSQLQYGRITLLLKEIGLQSISGAQNRRHHFEFEVNELSDRLLLTPIAGHDTYIFTDPIKEIHGLTLCFYNPFDPLEIPNDILNANLVSVTSPPFLELQLHPGQTHNLVLGDVIFIKGVSTSSSTINRYLNRLEGHLIGTGTTPSLISLNPTVDGTPLGLAPVHASGAIKIIIPKNRLRVTARIRCLAGRTTNFITSI